MMVWVSEWLTSVEGWSKKLSHSWMEISKIQHVLRSFQKSLCRMFAEKNCCNDSVVCCCCYCCCWWLVVGCCLLLVVLVGWLVGCWLFVAGNPLTQGAPENPLTTTGARGFIPWAKNARRWMFPGAKVRLSKKRVVLGIFVAGRFVQGSLDYHM